MAESDNREPDSRISPQVERGGLPRYYVNSDIPHVLARVRLVDTLLGVLRDREDVPQKTRDWLEGIFTDATNYSLVPYALDLARSLISLEDSLPAPSAETEEE
jgi:hypothetical protein